MRVSKRGIRFSFSEGALRIIDPGVWGCVKIEELKVEKSLKLLASMDRIRTKSCKRFLKMFEIDKKSWKIVDGKFWKPLRKMLRSRVAQSGEKYGCRRKGKMTNLPDDDCRDCVDSPFTNFNVRRYPLPHSPQQSTRGATRWFSQRDRSPTRLTKNQRKIEFFTVHSPQPENKFWISKTYLFVVDCGLLRTDQFRSFFCQSRRGPVPLAKYAVSNPCGLLWTVRKRISSQTEIR